MIHHCSPSPVCQGIMLPSHSPPSLPSSLLPSFLCALHSCCQAGVALIFLSLVRYAETGKPTNLSFSLPFLLSFCFLPRSVQTTPADLLVFSAFYQREKGGVVSAVVSLSLMCTESDSGKALSQPALLKSSLSLLITSDTPLSRQSKSLHIRAFRSLYQL